MGVRLAFEPLVSIVIPVYNGANYLAQAIDSALAQTYQPIEILVVNDGSRDDGATERVARSYGDRIRYWAKPNGGVATALNDGIAHMRGEYFSWLSHDDVYYPEKIAVQVAALAALPESGRRVVLFSDYDEIDAQSRRVTTHGFAPLPPSAVAARLLSAYPVHGCTVLIPRSCFDEVGLFDPGLPTTQDYHFWFRLAKQVPMVHLPGALIGSRVHPEQGHWAVPHAREADALFRWALGYLSAAEASADGALGSPAEAYYALAHALRWKRAFHAAQRALNYSLRHLPDEGWPRRLELGPQVLALWIANGSKNLVVRAVRLWRHNRVTRR